MEKDGGKAGIAIRRDGSKAGIAAGSNTSPMKKIRALQVLLALASFALSAYFYPQMPEKIASHWGVSGGADGYTGKFWGLFLLPIISAGAFALFLFLPSIDPMKKNMARFKGQLDWFLIALLLFFLYLQSLIIIWNLGFQYDMGQALSPAFGLLFIATGSLISNAEQNWFFGIRTPWTLSSKSVWKKTHGLGGILFKACGAASFLGLFFPTHAFYLLIVPAIACSAFLFAFSYLEYRKEKRQ